MNTDKKYDKMAGIYDYLEEKFDPFSEYRKLGSGYLKGKVLELGVGSGANLKYYAKDADVTGVDFSAKMLAKSEVKKGKLGLDNVKLIKMDIEEMEFEDGSFDTVYSTFVFCTVPNPEKGLAETYRVLKDDGRAVFIEHMKSENIFINLFLHMMNIFSKLVFGTSMVRKTEENIEKSGFKVVEKRNLVYDVLRLIVAEK